MERVLHQIVKCSKSANWFLCSGPIFSKVFFGNLELRYVPRLDFREKTFLPISLTSSYFYDVLGKP